MYALFVETLLCCFILMVGQVPIKKLREGSQTQLDGNWSSFQLANSTPPLGVIGNAIAPSARIILS